MARERTAGDAVDREAAFGNLPVLREERIWRFGDFTAVNVGLAIATWAFLIGGSTALFVGAKQGLAAIVIGNLVGVVLMALATCMASGKYGLEQYTGMRAIFGTNGIRLIVFGFVMLIEMGWAAVLAIMFGRGTVNVGNELGLSAGPNSLLVSVMGLVAIAAAWAVLARGPVSIKWVNRFVAPGLAVITIVMLALIFSERSWGDLLAAEPIEPFGDPALDFMIAVEFNIAAGLSWWPVMGSLARLTTTQRAALWPNLIGLFLAAAVAEAAGLFAALSLGSDDPTQWMIPLGGAALGILALVFIAAANLTSIVSIIYSTCLAIRQAGGAAIGRLRWEVLTAAFFVPPALAVFFPAAIYDNFFQFLVWTALGFAPLTGVCLADYFLLRRQRLRVRALYDHRPGSPYAYWGGINPAALAGVVAGAIVYLVLLNPRSLASTAPFEYLSASVPSVAAAGVVHWVLTKLVVQRAGRGGYGAEIEEPPVRERLPV